MDLEPIIVEVKPPKTPFKFPKLPQFGNKSTKIIAIVAAVVIIISIAMLLVFTVLANNSAFKKTHNITNATDEIAASVEAVKSSAALPGGSSVIGKGGTAGTNSPVIVLSASQAAVSKGGKVTLTWTASNNPKSCVASDDWSGDKPANGTFETPALTNLQTYLFTLTCKTDTGTGFSTVSVSTIEQGGTGSVGRPTVTLAAQKSSVTVGQSATLVWSTTNSPTSCTASDDWSGAKTAEGSASSGALGTTRSYKFTLTCANSSGTGYASTTVEVTAPLPDVPEVLISSNPVGPITPGSSATLTWTASNNPSSCVASDGWSGAKAASGSQSTGALNIIQVYGFTLTCTNASGSTFETATLSVLPDMPTVAITASPGNINIGSNATINWSSTNNPTSCAATGNWSGAKASSGAASTGTLNTVGTYLYTITCTNQKGTSEPATATVIVTLPAKPVVTLSANPSITTAGNSSTLTWSATNSPTSCTANGDWSGAKTITGSVSTGVLNTVKTYSYSLSCSNAGGSGTATTSVSVSSGAPAALPPVITIAASPNTIGNGSSSTISWSATNSPTSCTASGDWSGSQAASGSTSTGTLNTARAYTYTLLCTNTAGSDTKSATVTVIAIPVVSISLSPVSINTGSSSTVTWSVTNTPTSCTAGGSWSGTKAASGSQTTGAMATAGTFNFSLSCTNAGGTGTNSASLTVNNVAPVYCGGLGPCYGPSTLALHTSTSASGSCWSYMTGGGKTVIYNMTGFATRHSGGSSVILTTANCGHAVDWTGAPSNAKHTSAKSNTQATLNGYSVGYYDATKP